jgi:hypothetical protein
MKTSEVLQAWARILAARHLWVFEFLFGCHHRKLSRIFTIQKRTYQVCIRCGRQFEYSWELMQPVRSSPAENTRPSLSTVRQAGAPAI